MVLANLNKSSSDEKVYFKIDQALHLLLRIEVSNVEGITKFFQDSKKYNL